MVSSVDIAEMFGEDVVHLHGNLYRVRRGRIRMAKSGLSVEGGRLVYGNPRWFLNKNGELEARGTESSKMDELKQSIRNTGLDNPIRLRPVEGDEPFLEVVNGERRFRCIESLCASNDPCHDASVGDTAPASEVYEWVDCRIEAMDDEVALGVALRANETSEVIGDLASFHVVKMMRDSGHDDQDILRATGKSPSWLRETDRIMGLDEASLDHFHNDRITRKAAIQLALIGNAEERLSILERIVEVARGRKESKVSSLEEAARKAERDEEVASAAAEVADEHGDEEESGRLREKSRKAKERAAKARKESEKAAAKPAKADVRDIKSLVESADDEGKVDSDSDDPSESSGILSEYLEVIGRIIESGGFDDEEESLGLDLGAMSAVQGVLGAILDGEEDIMSVLSCHCGLPVEEDEENEDDEDEEEFGGDEEAFGESDADDDAEEAVAEFESEFRGASFEEDYD